MAEVDGIRLESTTDTPEQVNAALGIEPQQEVETPGATTGPQAQANDRAATGGQPSETPAASATAEAAAVEADGDDSEGDETPTDPQQPRPPRRNAQRRINELVAQRKEAERKAAELERRLEALEQPPAQPSSDDETPQKSQPEGDRQGIEGRPTPDDYDDYDDYVEALTDWKMDQKLEAAEKAREARERGDVQERTWQEKISAAQQKYGDWNEIFEVGEVLVSPAVAEVVQSSEVGADILYHLGNDPELLQRLNGQSSIVEVAKELGRIEAQFLSDATAPSSVQQSTQPAAPQTQPRQATTRPAPLNPVTPTTTSTPNDPSDMSFEDYDAWREKGGGR